VAGIEEEEAEEDVDLEVEEEVAGEVEEVAVVLEEDQMSSWNRTDIQVFSSPKAKKVCWSPKTWSLEKPSTEKNAYQSKEVWMVRKQNIEFGILSDQNWLLVFWVVWIKSISNLERRCCTLVLQVERVLAMLRILLGLRELCMR